MKIVSLHKVSKTNPKERGSKLLLEVNPRDVSNDIPLTKKALSNWRTFIKADTGVGKIGYAKFNGLNKRDILSIISATKRQEAHLNSDRWGAVAFYNLRKL